MDGRTDGRTDGRNNNQRPWGHLGHDEPTETGAREFEPRPGHYNRMSF